MKDRDSKTPYGDLTIEDIKACIEFKDVSDELAQQIADAIRVYTEIIYNCYFEERFEEQKAKVISINQGANKKAA